MSTSLIHHYFYSNPGGSGALPPTIQATDLVFSNVLSTTLTLSWTSGNGERRVVVAKAGTVDSNPVDGTAYTANAAFGSGDQIGTGNFVVYDGTGSTVNITGLTAGTEYHFRVYEYNGETAGINYMTDTATGNPANVTPAFSFWAAFQDDDATPVANPYTTYSGQLMDVTQTAAQLSIATGELVKTGAGDTSSNILKSQLGTARARGLCLSVRFKYTSISTTVITGGYGQSSASFAHGFLVSSNLLQPINSSSIANPNITLAPATYYHVFTVIRDNGAYWIVNIGADYFLFGVCSRFNYASIYQYVSVGGTVNVDYAREKQLAGPFTSSDWGLASQSIPLAVNGSTFTHSTSSWISFVLVTKATSGSIELRFRIQDATNYLKLTINSSNVGQLWETVAGVDAQLGLDGTMTQGAEYRIFMNGSNIRIFHDGSTGLLINGTSANFTSETDGELTSQGTGGDISRIDVYPYQLTDISVLAELEAITAVSEPP